MKSFLITGANVGLGKETARQLALKDDTQKIYLACRNEAKAQEAKRSLEESTGKKIFEIIIMDTSNQASVKKAITQIKEPIDGLLMNAGGMGGKTPGDITEDGLTMLFASNVIGHTVLLETLLKEKKLKKVVRL